jgi:hypothetical protein
MGPMNDDDEENDEMVTRPAAATPVKSDAPEDATDAGKGGGDGLDAPADEGLGFPGIEEAGYGYGV